MINPNLLSVNVATTSWQLYTADSSSRFIDGSYTNLFPTPALEGVAVTVNVVSVASTNPTDSANGIVFAEATLTISFTPNSDLPSNAIVEIGLPTSFASSPATEECTQSLSSSTALSCSYTIFGGYITIISINNPCGNND